LLAVYLSAVTKHANTSYRNHLHLERLREIKLSTALLDHRRVSEPWLADLNWWANFHKGWEVNWHAPSSLIRPHLMPGSHNDKGGKVSSRHFSWRSRIDGDIIEDKERID
jgi:hypothetical protein